MCRDLPNSTSLVIIVLTSLLLILPKTSISQDARVNPIPAYQHSLLLPETEYTGRTVASNEEKNFFLKMKKWFMDYLLQQPEFRGIEDHVISYPTGEKTGYSDCPMNDSEITAMLDAGLGAQLPEICYYYYTSYIHYPQKIGSLEVDQMVKAWAESQQKNNDACLFTYLISRPSSRYVSIAFCYQPYWRGSKTYEHWTVYNFDLERGRSLDLVNVFPNMEYSKPLLEEYILRKQLYPEWIDSEWTYPLDMTITRLFLTPDGVYIIYNLYEQGAYAEGIKTAYIPVADMPKLGGNTVFWEK